jgi:sec-independent protein translocase protein TatA
MGISGIGIWQLVIILAIIILLFGTKRLRSVGTDLGSAIKSFKKSVSDDETEKTDDSAKNVGHDDKQDTTASKQQEKNEQK